MVGRVRCMTQLVLRLLKKGLMRLWMQVRHRLWAWGCMSILSTRRCINLLMSILVGWSLLGVGRLGLAIGSVIGLLMVFVVTVCRCIASGVLLEGALAGLRVMQV